MGPIPTSSPGRSAAILCTMATIRGALVCSRPFVLTRVNANPNIAVQRVEGCFKLFKPRLMPQVDQAVDLRQMHMEPSRELALIDMQLTQRLIKHKLRFSEAGICTIG